MITDIAATDPLALSLRPDVYVRLTLSESTPDDVPMPATGTQKKPSIGSRPKASMKG